MENNSPSVLPPTSPPLATPVVSQTPTKENPVASDFVQEASRKRNFHHPDRYLSGSPSSSKTTTFHKVTGSQEEKSLESLLEKLSLSMDDLADEGVIDVHDFSQQQPSRATPEIFTNDQAVTPHVYSNLEAASHASSAAKSQNLLHSQDNPPPMLQTLDIPSHSQIDEDTERPAGSILENDPTDMNPIEIKGFSDADNALPLPSVPPASPTSSLEAQAQWITECAEKLVQEIDPKIKALRSIRRDLEAWLEAGGNLENASPASSTQPPPSASLEESENVKDIQSENKRKRINILPGTDIDPRELLTNVADVIDNMRFRIACTKRDVFMNSSKSTGDKISSDRVPEKLSRALVADRQTPIVISDDSNWEASDLVSSYIIGFQPNVTVVGQDGHRTSGVRVFTAEPPEVGNSHGATSDCPNENVRESRKKALRKAIDRHRSRRQRQN